MCLIPRGRALFFCASNAAVAVVAVSVSVSRLPAYMKQRIHVTCARMDADDDDVSMSSIQDECTRISEKEPLTEKVFVDVLKCHEIAM